MNPLEQSGVAVHVDKNSGRRYSFNSKSGVTAWVDDDKEEDKEDKEKEEEKVHEEVHVDKKSGRRYSFNSKSGVTAWVDDYKQEDKKKGGEEEDAPRPSRPVAPTEDDWVETHDPASGRKYRYNSMGQTTWVD